MTNSEWLAEQQEIDLEAIQDELDDVQGNEDYDDWYKLHALRVLALRCGELSVATSWAAVQDTLYEIESEYQDLLWRVAKSQRRAW